MPGRRNAIEVLDAGGQHVESQVLAMDAATHRARLTRRGERPALGYKTYFVRAAAKLAHSGPRPARFVTANDNTLENGFVRVKVDPQTGCMTSLFDKRSQTEALAPPETDYAAAPQHTLRQSVAGFRRQAQAWDAWNIDADFEKQHWDLDKADEVKLVEHGPLRAVIRVKNHFQNSTFVRDITMYAGVPRVDVKMHADWHEKHILLKVAFPVSAHNEKATFEIPYGSIERPTTRNTPAEQAKFEVPAQRWADLSDAKHGFSLLNDCKYGYDAKGNVLRLSLLRSPEWPDPHADEGHHEFTYSLYPHGGGWREAMTVRRGYELNYKLISRQAQKHSGNAPGASIHSYSVEADNVVVTALKKAEDDDSLVLRFYEYAGKDGDVKIQLPDGAQSASETDLMEKSIVDLAVRGNAITVHTKPYDIKTVKVRVAGQSHDTVDKP